MFASETAVITIDLASAATIGTAMAGAIVAHARLIVAYLERKDADHKSAIDAIREDSKTLTEDFREEVREARAEYREMVKLVVERLSEAERKSKLAEQELIQIRNKLEN